MKRYSFFIFEIVSSLSGTVFSSIDMAKKPHSLISQAYASYLFTPDDETSHVVSSVISKWSWHPPVYLQAAVAAHFTFRLSQYVQCTIRSPPPSDPVLMKTGLLGYKDFDQMMKNYLTFQPTANSWKASLLVPSLLICPFLHRVNHFHRSIPSCQNQWKLKPAMKLHSSPLENMPLKSSPNTGASGKMALLDLYSLASPGLRGKGLLISVHLLQQRSSVYC